jgi:hypothetical protein
MPRGTGIYEDEPRDHRHSYSPGPNDGDDPSKDETPDVSASDDSSEPTA